jgi:hypothetical protein
MAGKKKIVTVARLGTQASEDKRPGILQLFI